MVAVASRGCANATNVNPPAFISAFDVNGGNSFVQVLIAHNVSHVSLCYELRCQRPFVTPTHVCANRCLVLMQPSCRTERDELCPCITNSHGKSISPITGCTVPINHLWIQTFAGFSRGNEKGKFQADVNGRLMVCKGIVGNAVLFTTMKSIGKGEILYALHFVVENRPIDFSCSDDGIARSCAPQRCSEAHQMSRWRFCTRRT